MRISSPRLSFVRGEIAFAEATTDTGTPYLRAMRGSVSPFLATWVLKDGGFAVGTDAYARRNVSPDPAGIFSS